MSISASTTVQRAPGLELAKLDAGETVVLSADLEHYYGLNRVASRVWELTESPRMIGSICADLVDEFDVDLATCQNQVLALVEELLAESLVVVLDPRS